jgi:hypothetical protein
MSGLLRAVARVGNTDLIDSDGEIIPKSAWASQVGKIVPFKNLNGGEAGVAKVEIGPDGEPRVAISLWHDFSKYAPKIATEPEPELGPFEPGPPARGHLVKRRSVRDIMRIHGLPEPSQEVQQARVDFVTRKPMGNE